MDRLREFYWIYNIKKKMVWLERFYMKYLSLFNWRDIESIDVIYINAIQINYTGYKNCFVVAIYIHRKEYLEGIYLDRHTFEHYRIPNGVSGNNRWMFVRSGKIEDIV